MAQKNKTTYYVKGMHCDSCDILIKQQLSGEKHIVDICPNHATQTVEITHIGPLDKGSMNKKISRFGYSIIDFHKAPKSRKTLQKLGEAVAIGIVLLIGYYFVRELQITSVIQAPAQMNYVTVFLLGLVASVSTCMATSGALFLSTVGNKGFIPALSFNIGRILSYSVFGFIVGVVGNSFAQSLNGGAVLNIFIAVIMGMVGLDMLQLVSLSSFTRIPFTKRLFSYLQDRLTNKPRRTAFVLGAITYLLPCGFTQTVQLYALGLANPWQSALTMTSFALGTVPVLLMFGFATSFLQSSFYKQLSKVVAVGIILLSLSYLGNAMQLYGIGIPWFDHTSPQASTVLIKDGYQIATMNAGARGYYPNLFTIKQGIPVRWVVNGENIYGCQGELVAPKLALQKTLKTGENIIEFTPKEKGLISFSCTMGMFQGKFKVI